MYISATNIVFNIMLVYLYVGDYTDTHQVSSTVVTDIAEELQEMGLDIKSEETTVNTGYTKQYRCAYVTTNISVILKSTLQYREGEYTMTGNTISRMRNLPNTKRVIKCHNYTLTKVHMNHTCSECILTTPFLFNNISLTVRTSNPKLLTRKQIFSSPYIVLHQKEYDDLKTEKHNFVCSKGYTTP